MTTVLRTTPSQIRAQRQPPAPATYTVKEVAALLGLHLGGVYELLQDGTIPAKQFRRRWIISRAQFHAWSTARRSAVTDGEHPATAVWELARLLA